MMTPGTIELHAFITIVTVICCKIKTKELSDVEKDPGPVLLSVFTQSAKDASLLSTVFLQRKDF